MKYEVNRPDNYDEDVQPGETKGNSSMLSWHFDSNRRSNHGPGNENEQLCDKESRLTIVVALLTITVVALLVTLTLQIAVLHKQEYREICQSVECVKTAARMLEAMNRSIDPCQDFYEFACGGWISKNPIPRSQAFWDQLSFLRDQLLRNLRMLLEESDKEYEPKSIKLARALYRTCVNTTSVEALGLKPIHETLIKLGLPKDPPTSNGNWTTMDVSWFSGVAQRMLGLNLFIQFYVTEDIQDTSKNRITLSPKITERYFLDPQRFHAELNEYKKYVKNMVELAGAGNESTEFANEIFDFSTKLAKVTATLEEKRNGSYPFHELTIEELQQLTDFHVQRFNWTRYIEAVFEDTNVTIDIRTDRAIVINLRNLQELPKLLATESPRTIARFLWWSVYSTIAPLTLQRFRDILFQFLQNVLGLKEQRARWKDCTENANANFGMALSYVYAERYLDERTRKKALEMLLDVKNAFHEMIAELDWMDVVTRSRAHDKLRATRLYVGIPEWITDSEKLDKYYEGSEVISGKLFETFLRLTDAGIKKNLNSLREKPDRSRWISTGTAVNAFYSATLNSVTFPAGILHPPFYGNGLESINYGAMGAIMGHELTHGFDDQGRRYDETGNVKQWWSEETLRHYQKKVECIIRQYDNYRLPQLGENFTVNGVNTQGENIADNGGIREAYRAYQRHEARSTTIDQTLPGFADYTRDQLFFLGFAQVWCGNYTSSALKSKLIGGVHAPNHFRVIGTLSNNADFAKAWNCPIGSRMNPVDKCILW